MGERNEQMRVVEGFIKGVWRGYADMEFDKNLERDSRRWRRFASGQNSSSNPTARVVSLLVPTH